MPDADAANAEEVVDTPAEAPASDLDAVREELRRRQQESGNNR